MFKSFNEIIHCALAVLPHSTFVNASHAWKDTQYLRFPLHKRLLIPYPYYAHLSQPRYCTYTTVGKIESSQNSEIQDYKQISPSKRSPFCWKNYMRLRYNLGRSVTSCTLAIDECCTVISYADYGWFVCGLRIIFIFYL